MAGSSLHTIAKDRARIKLKYCTATRLHPAQEPGSHRVPARC